MRKRLDDNKNRNTGRVILALVLLLFLFFLLWFLFRKKPAPIIVESFYQDSAFIPPDTSGLVKDTLPLKQDTVKQDTISKIRIDTVVEKPVEPISEDTVVYAPVENPDSTQDSAAVIMEDVVPDPCRSDTAELWVYPDPSGGLHRKAIKVRFHSNRVCTISWHFAGNTGWTVYDGNVIKIDSTMTLVFKAADSCGGNMEIREEYYEIEKSQVMSPCPSEMEFIKIGNTEFCIDRYEWPNRKSVIPISYISLYHAQDSCFSAGKRLCTSEEWYLACSGPQGWKYPYGQKYERYACATHDTTAPPSGSKPECRGYFDVYDMSGGLMEWTDTRASENSHFNYVMGGFWQSGPQSGCGDKRYSYYPQNSHNPVGFRCCRDLPEKN